MYGDLPELHLVHSLSTATFKINALTDFSMPRLLDIIHR